MFSLLLSSLLTQSTPATLPAPEVIQTQEVRPLPGKLDTVPVFNSNSPELVLKEGILLSTFPPDNKKNPNAHLNYPFQGRFDVFAHHVAKAEPPEDLRSLYLGIMLHNPGTQPVTINILQAASYLSQPDAPFIQLPAMSQNILGNIFAGPGDRAVSDILRGRRQEIFPPQIVISPGENQMLLNLPIPVKELTPPLNGRSTLIRLNSTGQVYAASMALLARQNPDGTEGEPTLQEWENLLRNGELSTPRDRVPTPLEATKQPQIYGRVAGVAQGSQWKSLVLDHPQARYLTIPKSGQAFSYPISSLHGGTLGTSQIQAAPMLLRYPDTAYRAHGNYGIQYSLHLPLRNNTPNTQTVAVSLQTPIKEENLLKQGLRFFTTTAPQVFFRGSVRLRYTDDRGNARTQFTHLVQRRGQPGEPLVLLNMPPGDHRLLEVDLIYPPDATPPQVLTISTQ